MIQAARGPWSEKQILAAIHGANDSRQIRFRYDVIRNGARVRSIAAEGSVSLNRFAEIHRTARFTLYEELDWLKEELKPYMLLRMGDAISSTAIYMRTCAERDALQYTCAQWDALNMTCAQLDEGRIGTDIRTPQYAEFPLGVFVLSTPARVSDNAGLNTWSVDAYDHTVIIVEDCLTEPLYFPKGTLYLDAVQEILLSAGVTDVMIQDYVDTALRTDREFERGMKKKVVINRLLSEINFESIFCDADGRFIIAQYREPSESRIDYTYRNDRLSIIGRATQSELDYYAVPNVFVAVVSNPELDIDLTSIYINDNPASKLSTVQRGRRIVTDPPYQPESIDSQAVLDSYIRRIAFQANQVYEKLTFRTALNPLHGRAETLEIVHDDVTGVFVESSWEIPLTHDGWMTHTARRLVKL